MVLGPLRQIPLFKVLAIAQIGLLARRHANHLDGGERRRLMELVRRARGRPANLTTAERDELRALTAKLEPWAFTKQAAAHLSPLPVPGRLLRRRRAPR